MGKQHDVVHTYQFGRHIGLAQIDIEPGRQDGLVSQRLDQRRLVDHRASRHVDQDALRAQRPKHFGIDHVAALRPRPG